MSNTNTAAAAVPVPIRKSTRLRHRVIEIDNDSDSDVFSDSSDPSSDSSVSERVSTKRAQERADDANVQPPAKRAKHEAAAPTVAGALAVVKETAASLLVPWNIEVSKARVALAEEHDTRLMQRIGEDTDQATALGETIATLAATCDHTTAKIAELNAKLAAERKRLDTAQLSMGFKKSELDRVNARIDQNRELVQVVAERMDTIADEIAAQRAHAASLAEPYRTFVRDIADGDDRAMATLQDLRDNVTIVDADRVVALIGLLDPAMPRVMFGSTFVYASHDEASGNNVFTSACCACQDDYARRDLVCTFGACGHRMHNNCLKRLIFTGTNEANNIEADIDGWEVPCPLCRADVNRPTTTVTYYH